MEQSFKRKINKIWKYVGILAVLAVYIYFWLQPELLYDIKKDGSFTLRMKRTTVSTVMLLIGIYGCLMKRLTSEQKEKIRSLVMYALTPVVVLFFTEFANISGPGLIWRVISLSTVYRTILNLGLIYALILLVTALTNSLKFSSISVSILLGLFSMVCYYVNKFRGVPLLASDIAIAGTALNVLENYEYSMRFHDKIMLLGIAVWCLCLLRTRPVKLFAGKKRALFSAGYLAVFALGCMIWVNTPITKMLHLKINTYRPIKGYKNCGTLLNFATSFCMMVVEKPEGYSKEAAEEIAKPYREMAKDQGETVTPNLIIVMDEAFSDLQSIWEFETSEEILPFYRSLKENAVKGTIYVPYFGAQTANSEFEVLTGLSKAFLPAGATPYQVYINEELPNISTVLRNSGKYQGIIAMHPWYAKGYNRESAYQYMGFADFVSIEDMEYDESDLIRKFISDSTNVDMIIAEYEKAKEESDKPFYLFNVTMQNHSGYDQKYDNFDEPITIEEQYDDHQARQYVNLVKKSDEALEKLITYFSEVEEPTVVLFFGDHEPSVSPSFYENIMGKKLDDLSNEECMDRYRTPFVIWANYDIPEEEGIFTSTNYLAMLMKKYTGMEMTAFDYFLQDVMEELPVLSINGCYDTAGDYYEVSEKNSPYKEILLKYWTLEYNTLFDMKNRIENFFD